MVSDAAAEDAVADAAADAVADAAVDADASCQQSTPTLPSMHYSKLIVHVFNVGCRGGTGFRMHTKI